ncbi:MAG: hypothetical protein QOJ45_1678 [Verrucomicrobiota bacterium]|jgi:hypothetical protein
MILSKSATVMLVAEKPWYRPRMGMAFRAFGFFGLQGIRRGSVLKIADLT